MASPLVKANLQSVDRNKMRQNVCSARSGANSAKGASMIEMSFIIMLIAATCMMGAQFYGQQVKRNYCIATYQVATWDGGTTGTGLPGPESFDYECGQFVQHLIPQDPDD